VELVRVDFALIPDNPLFDAVITASQAITDEFYYNENVIDDKTFPPHLSLHICTVPRNAVSQLGDTLEALAGTGLPDIKPVGVEPSRGGYVMLSAERTPALMDLHETVLSAVAQARNGLGSDPFGSPYIRDFFAPHISLAKVDRDDQAEAAAIGREALGATVSARCRTLDLCDIGERSERWDVLASYPATRHPRTGGPAADQ
jgi:2'-5' RNA ligase superfamily